MCESNVCVSPFGTAKSQEKNDIAIGGVGEFEIMLFAEERKIM